MLHRSTPIGWFVGVVFAASLAVAAPKAWTIHVSPASAPASVDARTRAILRDAVRRHLSAAGLDESLRDYTVSPALVQLRRYLEPGSKTPQLVCVVDLALLTDEGALVATARGNATALAGKPADAVDAAAHSAATALSRVVLAKRPANQKKEIAER